MKLRRAGFAALILAGVTAISTLLAAAPATAAPSVLAQPSVNTHTCTFWRATAGPWNAMEATANKSLALTAASSKSGSKVAVRKYGDALTQCWKILIFSNFRFELQMANTSLCLNVPGSSKKAGTNLIVYPCRSQVNEMFRSATNANRTQIQGVNSGLCLTAAGGIKAGAGLVQEPCGRFPNPQSWFVDTSP